MQATQAELQSAKVDLAYRDFCAHLLIPLNECRKASFFLPWKCEHERHVYEKCQYKECAPPRHGPSSQTTTHQFIVAPISPRYLCFFFSPKAFATARASGDAAWGFAPPARVSLDCDGISRTTRIPPLPRRYMMRVAQQKAATGGH